VGIHSVNFLCKDRCDVNCNIRTEWIRTLKAILEVEEYGILFKRWCVSSNVRNCYHIGCVLNEYSRITMVGVIVVRSRSNYDVGIPFANLSNDLQAYVQCGQQRSVVVVQYIILYAKSFSCFLCFGHAPLGENTSTLRLMAGVTVGHGHKLYRMAHPGKQDRCATTILIAIVRMRTNHNDTQRARGLRREVASIQQHGK